MTEMAASQYPIHSVSPLDRLAGSYVELDDIKSESSPTYSSKDNLTMAKELPPAELPAQQPEDENANTWWVFEAVSWLVSASALVAILVTAALTDGKPLPDWPMDITLNSFISFMSTLMKAAAMFPVAECISQLKWLWFRKAGAVRDIQTFDEASRGIWGSFKLLVGTQGFHLAKLGALITIVLLAVEPFVQQAVTYQKKPVVLTDANSSVPIYNHYNEYAYGAIMAIREPTMTMKAAVNNGMFDTSDGPQLDFEITATCSTGNCTWASTYHSLAVCSKCANTTSQITQVCDSGFGTTSVSCNYTLPNGMSFDGSNGANNYLNASGEYQSLAYNNTQSTIAVLSSMRGLHDLSSTTLLGVVSNECVMYFCANEYQASVTSGVFNETVVASYTGQADPVVDQNITITVPGLDTQFWVSPSAWYALSLYFEEYWSGTVTGYTGRISSTDDVLTALYTFGEDGSGSGTQKVGGENNTIAAIAAAMTKALRTQDLPSDPSAWVANATTANGTSTDRYAVGAAWGSETYVHVRWPWMILPMALEVLELMFLVGTIIQSSNSGVPGWKSSTLPLIQGKVAELQQVFADKRRQR